MLDLKMDVEEVRHKVELSDVCKCNELKLRCERAEKKCEELELTIQTKKIECELLQGHLKNLESEKSAIEEELTVWMEKGREPGQQVSCAGDGKPICFEDGNKGAMNLIGKTDVENEVVQLLIENNVLAVEKKKAESEAEMWKDKFKKLEIKISKLDESFVLEDDGPVLSGRLEGGTGSPLSPEARVLDCVASNHHSLCKDIRDLQAGTPPNGSPHHHTVSLERGEQFRCTESYFKHGNQVRKQLNFEEESPIKKMVPLTPAVSRPLHGIINIDDSDDEPIIAKSPSNNQKKNEVCVSAAQDLSGCGCTSSEEKISNENKLSGTTNVEIMEAFSDDFIFNATPKRKRASNIITSDTETDDDDNVPICKLKRMPIQKTNHTQVSLELNDGPATTTSACDKVVDSATPARRRLVSLRHCYEKVSGKKYPSSQIINIDNRMKDVEDELEDTVSEQDSESESLDQFIVDSSDASDVGSAQSEDLSNGSEGYEEIISKLGRRKKELKWEYEADMLAAFGKDPELCMKAVCALYRQQTSEEKVSKESLFSNKRGFSKFDAIKGTRLAEFLTDGDPQGNLNKSVRELEEYDPNAINLCRKLATHYSKQLFEIYGNKEDPLFLPA
ncbi:hypothetical protein SDJN02_26052 [Cucurbita argyrosperma subsp. argyrosperma]|nr:hypothetical protein SDJN02_26052 [Cucurbita argyrosperma subsp. argyrosperma]